MTRHSIWPYNVIAHVYKAFLRIRLNFWVNQWGLQLADLYSFKALVFVLCIYCTEVPSDPCCSLLTSLLCTYVGLAQLHIFGNQCTLYSTLASTHAQSLS